MPVNSPDLSRVPGAVRAALLQVPRIAARLQPVVPTDLAPAVEQWAAAAATLTEWTADVEVRLGVVRAAEAKWHYFTRALESVWFQNAAGDLACVPFGLVQLLAAGETLPFVITTTDTSVIYARGTEEYCCVPKTLNVVLKDLIVGRPWENPGR